MDASLCPFSHKLLTLKAATLYYSNTYIIHGLLTRCLANDYHLPVKFFHALLDHHSQFIKVVLLTGGKCNVLKLLH